MEVVDESDDWALLALQGPEAADLLAGSHRNGPVGPQALPVRPRERLMVPVVSSPAPATRARTGFEIYLSGDDAPARLAPPDRGRRHTGRARRQGHAAPRSRDVPLRQRARCRDHASGSRHLLRGAPGQGAAVYRAEGALARRHRGACARSSSASRWRGVGSHATATM